MTESHPALRRRESMFVGVPPCGDIFGHLRALGMCESVALAGECFSVDFAPGRGMRTEVALFVLA